MRKEKFTWGEEVLTINQHENVALWEFALPHTLFKVVCLVYFP